MAAAPAATAASRAPAETSACPGRPGRTLRRTKDSAGIIACVRSAASIHLDICWVAW
jgi:hypothetical protein